jgi:serine/threonine-protein kinase
LAYCDLGLVLQRKGQFADALTPLRRGHELVSNGPQWDLPSARWVDDAQRLVAMEPRLPALLRGEAAPADALETATLARLCSLRERTVQAARLYRQAFAAAPQLSDDANAGYRYDAARAAARAGCGRGDDAVQLNDSERAVWRRQALEWLRAEPALWAKQVADDPPQFRRAAMLTRWQKSPDLAGLRDGAPLARLPETEQAEWRQFWADVRAAVAKARAGGGPAGKADQKP